MARSGPRAGAGAAGSSDRADGRAERGRPPRGSRSLGHGEPGSWQPSRPPPLGCSPARGPQLLSLRNVVWVNTRFHSLGSFLWLQGSHTQAVEPPASASVSQFSSPPALPRWPGAGWGAQVRLVYYCFALSLPPLPGVQGSSPNDAGEVAGASSLFVLEEMQSRHLCPGGGRSDEQDPLQPWSRRRTPRWGEVMGCAVPALP